MTDQISRDLAISRKKVVKKSGPSKLQAAREVSTEYASTLLVTLYVVNGLAASAILFEIVSAPKSLKFAVASLAIAYAAVGFVMFINRGVKHQLAEKRVGK